MIINEFCRLYSHVCWHHCSCMFCWRYCFSLSSISAVHANVFVCWYQRLRGELQRAEGELEDRCWSPPVGLQQWLQLTHEVENKAYIKKKNAAEKQLQQAREAVGLFLFRMYCMCSVRKGIDWIIIYFIHFCFPKFVCMVYVNFMNIVRHVQYNYT
jgi:hypothetical protein